MRNKYYLLLKPDCLDSKEMKLYTFDLLLKSNIYVIEKKVWKINEKEFLFLRRDSITKDYFDELYSNYCGQTHELLKLDLTQIHSSERISTLYGIRNSIRTKYATNFLINGIHIPTLEEYRVETPFYEERLNDK